jgi:replicative DNA helicase
MNHSPEVEIAVLGQLISFRDTYFNVSDLLNSDCFYDPFHKVVYESINRVSKKSKIDMITIVEDIINNKAGLPGFMKEAEFNTPFEVSELTKNISTDDHIHEHIHLLNQYRKARNLLQMSANIDKAIEEKTDPDEIIEQINEDIIVISDISNKRELNMHGCLLSFNTMLNKPFDARIVPTGIRELDAIIGGFEFTDLVIVAGAASMGKTSLALKIAMNQLLADKNILLFSLEMNVEQLMTRFISMHTSIPIRKIRYKETDEADMRLIHDSVTLYEEKSLTIDTVSHKLTTVVNKIKKYKLKDNIEGVIIDYLQLVSHTSQNREQEVAKIARTLKNVAKELDIYIIALSQLNRSLAMRENKRPILSDLRESGEIEQAADIIMFAYRESYYTGSVEEIQNAEIIVAKGRNSGIGTAHLQFVPEITKFLSQGQDTQEIAKYIGNSEF